MPNLSQKTVLLTGATSGIGKELLLTLLDKGANVAFCGRSAEKMAALAQQLGAFDSSRLYGETFCLSDNERIARFVSAAHSHFGRIDVLINNAGLNSARSEVVQMSMADFDWMMAINCKAPAVFMREAGKIMQEQRHGLVINVLSTVCLFSNEGIGGYTASKAALDALTKVFRKEVRKFNVRVLSVYPGGVDTPFRANQRPDYLSPKQVSDLIIGAASTDESIALDELVFRPMVEMNF
jgi:NAD(P)-dependent dehydrogenase (short-subunit alcohol dehydrogenase family)